MLIVILLACIGIFLMSKRIRQSILVYRTMKTRLKQSPQLFVIKSRGIYEWGFLLLSAASIIMIFYNIENPSSTGLGILTLCLSIGEFINAMTVRNFYHDQSGFYYYQHYLKIKDIKKLSEGKGFLGLSVMYSVETTHGDLFSVSKAAYDYLSQKQKGKSGK